MSGCGDVCITHDHDLDNEFYAATVRKARIQHKCCECSLKIAVGERYERAVGKCDGLFFSQDTCAVCLEIRNAFVCGTYIFGELWGSIREEMFPVWEKAGAIDCLAKLTTLEAREECRRRYARWLKARDE